MRNKKHASGSISTDVLARKIEAKMQGNSGVPTAETDKELLRLGITTDGRPQMTTDKPKKDRFKKGNDLDLGKYMSTGYSSDTGLLLKALKGEKN